MAVEKAGGTGGSPCSLSAHDQNVLGQCAQGRTHPSLRRVEGKRDRKESSLASLRWMAIILLLSVTACAGPEPLLRSNKQLQLYGKQMAQQEVEACQHKADEAGLRPGVYRSGNAAAGAA